jgi:ABC-2 type transport system ATP-binding protein
VGQLSTALAAAGITFSQHRATSSSGTLRAEAEPELVGRLAHQAGVALLELRAAEGAGLEEMFLELTADTQREGAAA